MKKKDEMKSIKQEIKETQMREASKDLMKDDGDDVSMDGAH